LETFDRLRFGVVGEEPGDAGEIRVRNSYARVMSVGEKAQAHTEEQAAILGTTYSRQLTRLDYKCKFQIVHNISPFKIHP